MLLTAADDPRAGSEVRGRAFRYRPEADAAAGQLQEIAAAEGGGVIFALAADTKSSRSYATKQAGGSTHYAAYKPGGNVAEKIDGHGFASTPTYDAAGRGFKIASTDGFGKTTRFENNAKGDVVKQINPDNTRRTWQRDARGRVLAATDELGQTRTYTRDTIGRVTKVQHPDGSAEEVAYNALGQPQAVKVRNGAVTVYSYDAKGLRTQATNALGYSSTVTYDAQDRISAVTDPRGNTTRMERDAAGRVTKIVNADGTSAVVAYDRFGQITKKTDASGVATTAVHDALGRTTSVFDSAGGETQMKYAPIGTAGAPLTKPVQVISPGGRTLASGFDANGRQITRTVGAGTREAAITRTAYDAAGRPTSVTDPRNRTTQLFYDDRGRRTKVMNALNNATSYTYDARGRKLSQTDAKGNTTRWTYDSMGRVLTTMDAKNQVTRFEYNAAGQRVAMIDAKGNIYRFEYDLLGRKTAMMYPDGSRETTSYDQAGNKRSFTNRAGTVQTFTYDSRNREIGSEWSDGTQKIVKAYDAAGRMTLEDNGVSRLLYEFDAAGRLAVETQDLSALATDGSADPAPRTVRTTYTADGQRDILTYPDGSFVKFSYNARGQMSAILGDGVTPAIASYDYDIAGNATLMPRENETETQIDYDALNRVTEITERGAQRGPVSELEYAYDDVGNRTSTTHTFNADGRGRDETKRDTYTYDETDQVTGADYGAEVRGRIVGVPESRVRFTYDAVGNRVSVSEDGKVTRYTVNSLNQYTQVGEFAPAHDRNGNLAAMGRWLYRYDALNRLVGASNGQMTAKFSYDARNRCVARSYNGATTLNYYDNWNLIEERDTAGKQVARYVHGRKIDEIVVMTNRHGVFYPHRDVLGNVTMLTDTAGKLVERYNYSVEGKVVIADAGGRTLEQSAVGNRWMFTGREWLVKVGLYDYRNRIYSTQVGRFFQSDPIRFSAGDVNIYRYAKNNSVRYTDPLGLFITPEHEEINQTAGSANGLTSTQIDAMNAGSAWADSGPNQNAESSYMHSMRNGQADQSVADAQAATQTWVDQMQNAAINAALNGDEYNSAFFMGVGAHAIEDGFASAHQGTQAWDGLTWNPITWVEAAIHGIQDVLDYFFNDSARDQATQAASDFISDTQGMILDALVGDGLTSNVTIGPIE